VADDTRNEIVNATAIVLQFQRILDDLARRKRNKVARLLTSITASNRGVKVRLKAIGWFENANTVVSDTRFISFDAALNKALTLSCLGHSAFPAFSRAYARFKSAGGGRLLDRCQH